MEQRRFTESVRQELAGAPTGDDEARRAELAALIWFAGVLTLHGGESSGVGVELTTTSGAVARRTFALLQEAFGLRAEVAVRSPAGVRRSTEYALRLHDAADTVLTRLGIIDPAGSPRRVPARRPTGEAATAFLRGAVLAAGSLSSPGREAHLEIPAGSREAAEHLAGIVAAVVGPGAHVTDGPRPRLVLKSGERIGEVLVVLGAPRAFLEWDERRLRRQLRGDANRLANADSANLTRSIEASIAQAAVVRRAVSIHGWRGLPEDLRAVALARLTNPEATLSELGHLLDPPVGKSAVHRRLRRLEELADDA